jgi:hypothetical protein
VSGLALISNDRTVNSLSLECGYAGQLLLWTVGGPVGRILTVSALYQLLRQCKGLAICNLPIGRELFMTLLTLRASLAKSICSWFRKLEINKLEQKKYIVVRVDIPVCSMYAVGVC